MTTCPNCDAELDEDGVCPECGFDSGEEDEEEWEGGEDWQDD